MDSIFKVSLILSALDKASAVVKSMSANVQKSLQNVQDKANKVSKSAADFGRKAGRAGLIIAAPLILATREAIKFEDKMADVAKVMNLEHGSAALKKMGNDVKALSIHLAQAPQDVADLVANIAAGGVKGKEVGQVSKLAGEMGVAFDIAGGEAGEAFIKIGNAMNATIAQTSDVMDGVNQLSNNMAVKAAELVTFLYKGGAAASNALKMSGADVSAVGAALISSGVSAEESGTIMRKLQKTMMDTRTVASKTFTKAGGGMEGMVAVLNKGLQSKNPAAYFRQFGEYSGAIQQLAKNMNGEKGLGKALSLVSDKTKYAGSVHAEFENRQKTMATQIAKLKTQFMTIVITIGEALMPALLAIMKAVKPLIDKFAKWIQDNPKLVKQIAMAAAGLAAFLLATSGVSYAVSGIAKGVAGLAKAFQFLAANPVVLIIIAIAGLVYLIYRNWKPISAFFKKVWDGIYFVIRPVVEYLKFIFWNLTPIGWFIRLWKPISGMFKALWGLVKTIFNETFIKPMKFIFLNFTPPGLIYKHWAPISAFFIRIWNKVKVPFVAVYNWVKNFGTRFFKAGENIIQSIIDGVKAKINKVTEVIKGVAKKIRDFFPFSPAKAGPLMDIHRIKLMETVAGSIKPAPVLNAVQNVTQKLRGSIPKLTGTATMGAGAGAIGGGSGGGSGISIVFSPTINITGGGSGDKDSILKVLKDYEQEFLRMVKDAVAKDQRKKF